MKVGFDIDNYDFTEYASALDGENLSSTEFSPSKALAYSVKS